MNEFTNGSRLLKLPTPHYIVLYTGEDDIPNRQTLHLSELVADCPKSWRCRLRVPRSGNISYRLSR